MHAAGRENGLTQRVQSQFLFDPASSNGCSQSFAYLGALAILGTGMDPASALQQMNFMKGWFDSDILNAFARTMGIYPIGSVLVLVLGSQSLALVVGQSPTDPTRPRVRTFFSIAEGKLIPAKDIDLSKHPAESIRGTGVPEDYNIEDFPRLREKLFAAAARSTS